MIIENYIASPFKCNFSCEFCYLGKDFSSKNIPYFYEKFFDLLYIDNKYIHGFDIKYYHKILGGESLVSIDRIFKLFNFLYLKSFDTIEIVTNGYFIDKFLDRFFTFNYKEYFYNKLLFSISIHGLGIYHDNIVGVKGAFDKVLRNIFLLTRKGFKIKLQMVINKNNYKNLYNLIKFFYKLGIKNIVVLLAIKAGSAKYNNSCIDDIDIFLYIRHIINYFRHRGFYIDIEAGYPKCLSFSNYDDKFYRYHFVISSIITKRFKLDLEEVKKFSNFFKKFNIKLKFDIDFYKKVRSRFIKLFLSNKLNKKNYFEFFSISNNFWNQIENINKIKNVGNCKIYRYIDSKYKKYIIENNVCKHCQYFGVNQDLLEKYPNLIY